MTTPLHVEVRTFSEINIKPRPLYPRIKHPSEKIESSSAFTDWISLFSDSFPQQEMMTVDLILAIRSEEERPSQGEEVLYDLNRHGELYLDDYSSFVESSSSLDFSAHSGNSPLTYKPQRTSILHPTFQNIYSPLPPNWNAA